MPKTYAISGGHETTVEIAEMILNEGGNAFDAAIAAHLTMYLTEPCMASAGAGGFALCYRESDGVRMLDFFTQTPRNKEDLLNRDFESIVVNFGNETEEFHIGMASIAAPGSVAALFELHKNYASMPFREIAAPVKDLARRGVPLNTFQSIDLGLLEVVFERDPSVKDIFFKDGRILGEGENLFMPHLEDFIDFLIDEGVDGFYKGQIGAQVDKDSRERGGYIRREDFENYRCNWRDVIVLEHLGKQIIVPNGPSVGGAIMGLLFKLQRENKHDWIRSILDFKKRKYTLKQIENAFNSNFPQLDYSLNSGPSANNGTSHFNIMDGDRNAIALTCTIGEGCGYFVPGTNMQMNNMMGESFLLPEGFHNWQKDVRLNSMMTPTMVLDAQGAIEFLCGSGGAGRIPYMIAQMLEYVYLKNMSLEEAMHASRVYYHNNIIQFETGYEAEIPASMDSKEWMEQSLFYGGVHSIQIDGDGSMRAMGDPRRYGVAVSRS